MFFQYLFKKIIAVADGISTRPNLTSWIWKGNASPLAFIILHIVYLTRICSLLQISKYIYRRLAKFANNSNEMGKNTFLDVYRLIFE